MKRTTNAFLNKFMAGPMMVAAMTFIMGTAIGHAAVVQRGTATRAPASRASSAVNRDIVTAPATTATVETNAPAVDTDPEPAIENKSDKFEQSANAGATSTSADDAARAAIFQRQRDAIAAAEAQSALASAQQKSATGGNACDTALRTCMAEKCGKDFTNCAGDRDTDWGDKMDACRRATKCSGREFTLFAAEIKADRDANATLANYQETLDCGVAYNSCLIAECGTTFTKCRGKSAGDAAIAKCGQANAACLKIDNGLASRAMETFATLRVDLEKQIKRDEEKLYALREGMSQACGLLGAMFDERTLMCVYTVNLFADGQTTPYASKKLFAGGSFDCTQNWFGIDITTFKENALRETETQSAVISGTMGAGLGMAAGMVSSGQLNRAIDRKKAENAVKKARDEKMSMANFSEQTELQAELDKKVTKAEENLEKVMKDTSTEKTMGTEIKVSPDGNGGPTWSISNQGPNRLDIQ